MLPRASQLEVDALPKRTASCLTRHHDPGRQRARLGGAVITVCRGLTVRIRHAGPSHWPSIAPFVTAWFSNAAPPRAGRQKSFASF